MKRLLTHSALSCSLFMLCHCSFGQVDSFAYFKELAEKGDTRAEYVTGSYYLLGKEAQLAKKWYGLAAEKHYPPALMGLAFIYQFGLTGDKDSKVAFQYANEASDSNYAEGQSLLGYYYLSGEGVASDSSVAEKYYRLAAAQNNPDAIATIGVWYFNGGMGMPQSYELARPYVEKAAQAGVARSEFEMGLMYQHGWGGFPIDTPEAMMWYDRASQQGHMTALNNYAWLCYLKKIKIEKGIQYIEAALRINPYSLNSLDTYAALLCLAGEYDEALKWQKKALDYGGDKKGGFVERYGDILCKSGKSKDAMKYWRTAQGIPGHSITLITKITTGQCQ